MRLKIFGFLAAAWVCYVFGYQNKYRVIQERCEIDCYVKSLSFASCNTYHLNRTYKVANMTLMFKEPSEDMLIAVSAYMWMTNQYKLIAIQFEMKVISVMTYSMFDLDDLFQNHSDVPLKRFFLPNVKYNFKGWAPDSKKFPPGLRSGKYKIRVAVKNGKKTVNYMIGNWYFTVEDIIRY